MKNTSNTLCVPLASLSLPGSGGSDVPPGVGDEVDFTGKGKVDRIEGDNAYLTVTTVNDQPVNADAATADEPDLDDEEGAMRADAAKTDSNKDQVY